MAPAGDHGAAERKNLRMLLPFTRDSLRIPDELAGEIGGGKSLVVGQYKGEAKVWSVELGKDADGAFLGRGWPEFSDACGAGEGWFLVLRHRGRGLLTVKAFDGSGCLTELGAPPEAEGNTSSIDASRRPQFISVLSPGSMEKMLMHSKIVEQYLPIKHLSNRTAIVYGPLGKVCPIELEMNWPDVFFAGGWSKFLAFHGIIEANYLLLRYEGNMVFTVKVFGADGCQNKSKYKNTVMQQCFKEKETVHEFSLKCRSKKDWPSEGQIKQKISMAPLHKPSLQKISVFDIGPPSWIKKQINKNALNNRLNLATSFCDAIGLRDSCMITLKTSMHSNESWQVHGAPDKNKCYRLGQGWRKFCQENSLELGDICTFNIVETTVWHVVVTRYKDSINQLCDVPSSTSSRKFKSKNSRSCTTTTIMAKPSSLKQVKLSNNMSSNKRKRGPECLRNYLKKPSRTNCSFQIGPPAWIKKEIKTCSTKNTLYLPPVFCEAIGITKLSNVTLKTSISDTRSWQVHVAPYKNSSHHVAGPGWKSFCRDNQINVGDICTINIFETTLWQVDIMRR